MELTEFKLAFIEANRHHAVKDAAAAKFRDAEKTCVYTTRISVQSSFDKVSIAAFASSCSVLQVVSGLAACMKPRHFIDTSAVAKLANFEIDSKDGQYSKIGALDFTPIVLANANSSIKFGLREIFGQVASGRRCNCKDESVQAANEEDYGVVGHKRPPEKQVNLHQLPNAVFGGQVRE